MFPKFNTAYRKQKLFPNKFLVCLHIFKLIRHVQIKIRANIFLSLLANWDIHDKTFESK